MSLVLLTLAGGCTAAIIAPPHGPVLVTLIRQKQQARVTGFPPIKSEGVAEQHTFHAALESVLAGLGWPMSYDELMGLSGAAFRTQFNSSGWDVRSADVVVGEDCGVSVLAAIGIEAQLHTIDRGRRDAAAALIESIAQRLQTGMPLMAEGLGVGRGWCILVGHRVRPLTWWCRAPGDPAEAEDRTARTWPRAVLLLSPPRPMADLRPVFIASLRRAVTLFDLDQSGGYAVGRAAMRRWADALESGPPHESIAATAPASAPAIRPADLSPPPPAIGTWDEDTQRVHRHLYSALLSSRRAAAGYLRRLANLMVDHRPRLIRAADLYDREATLLLDHSTDASPQSAARVLRECLELEEKAIAILKKVASVHGMKLPAAFTPSGAS